MGFGFTPLIWCILSCPLEKAGRSCVDSERMKLWCKPKADEGQGKRGAGRWDPTQARSHLIHGCGSLLFPFNSLHGSCWQPAASDWGLLGPGLLLPFAVHCAAL